MTGAAGQSQADLAKRSRQMRGTPIAAAIAQTTQTCMKNLKSVFMR